MSIIIIIIIISHNNIYLGIDDKFITRDLLYTYINYYSTYYIMLNMCSKVYYN